MITQKQKLLLDKLSADPKVNMLISRLQLEPIPSQAYKTSRAVDARISQWFQDFQKAHKPRQVIQTTFTTPSGIPIPLIFQPAACIEAILISLYGPRPWTYPLTSCPF